MLKRKCKEKQIPYTFVSFSPDDNPNASEYSARPIALIADIAAQLPNEYMAEVFSAIAAYEHRKEKEDHVARAFQRAIIALMKKRPVVLFFDETEQADQDKVVPWLEKWVINPLARKGRCLFVWAGRRPQRWERFEVRRRVHKKELRCFDEAGTKALFSKNSRYSIGDLAIPVRAVTGGHPYADTIILQYLDNLASAGQQPVEGQFDEVVPALLAELHENFVKKFIFRGVDKYIAQACETMSLVRQFDVIMLREILTEANAKVFGKYERFQFGALLFELRATQLIVWDERRKGYAIDPSLRHIISEHICYQQPEIYAQVNQKAIDVYQDWIERAGDNRSVYIVEELYHQACLHRVPQYVTPSYQKDLVDLLRQRILEYRQSDPDLRASALHRLYREIEGDADLLHMIGEQRREDLLEIVERERTKIYEESRLLKIPPSP